MLHQSLTKSILKSHTIETNGAYSSSESTTEDCRWQQRIHHEEPEQNDSFFKEPRLSKNRHRSSLVSRGKSAESSGARSRVWWMGQWIEVQPLACARQFVVAASDHLVSYFECPFSAPLGCERAALKVASSLRNSIGRNPRQSKNRLSITLQQC